MASSAAVVCGCLARSRSMISLPASNATTSAGFSSRAPAGGGAAPAAAPAAAAGPAGAAAAAPAAPPAPAAAAAVAAAAPLGLVPSLLLVGPAAAAASLPALAPLPPSAPFAVPASLSAPDQAPLSGQVCHPTSHLCHPRGAEVIRGSTAMCVLFGRCSHHWRRTWAPCRRCRHPWQRGRPALTLHRPRRRCRTTPRAPHPAAPRWTLLTGLAAPAAPKDIPRSALISASRHCVSPIMHYAWQMVPKVLGSISIFLRY
jgi:hypothetical protein